MPQKNFVHPYTYTVISEGMNYPLGCLRQNDWTGFLRGITDFCLLLDPELKAELREELKELHEMRYHDRALDQSKILDAADIIYTKLHEKGYILGTNMTPPDRDTGQLGGLAALKFGNKMRGENK